MKIPVEIGFIAMQGFADIIRQFASIGQACLFEKDQSFILKNTLLVQDFFSDVTQDRIGLIFDQYFYLFISVFNGFHICHPQNYERKYGSMGVWEYGSGSVRVGEWKLRGGIHSDD